MKNDYARFLFAAIVYVVAMFTPVYAQWAKIGPAARTSSVIKSVVHGTGGWVAVGERGMIATWGDGYWNEQPSVSAHTLNSIQFTGSRYVAVGDGGLILVSANGEPRGWSVVESHTTLKLTRIQQLEGNWYALGENGLILVSADGVEWSVMREGGETSNGFVGLVLFNGTYTAAIRNDSKLWRSANLRDWTKDQSSLPISYPSGIGALNGKLVVWGLSGGLAYSSDGATWTSVLSPLPSSSSDAVTDVAFVGGRYYLTGSDRFESEKRSIYTSTNLVNWSATDGMAKLGVSWDGAMFCAIDGLGITTSPDGTHWKNVKGFLSYPAVFAGGSFRAVDRNFLYTSIDGQTWSESRLPTGVSGSGVYEANGMYLTHGGGKVSISTDFVSWQTATFTAGALGDDFVYAFGKYYATVRGAFSTSVYKSANGLSWSSFTAGVGVAYGNDRLVTVNSYSNVFQYAVSTDGVVATQYSLSGQPGANAVAFGNGLFVAVSGWSGYEVRTSSDGVAWTAQQVPSVQGDLTEIVFRSGRFVARGKGRIITSENGVDWQDISYPAWEDENRPPYSISYGNGVWLLSGGFPLRSSSFPEWELLTDIFDQTFSRVRYRNGAFWALSSTTDNITTGTLWTSTDGLEWSPVARFPFYPVDFVFSSTGRLVVAGDFNKVAVSDNLTSWQIVESGLGRIRQVAYGDNRYYAGSQSGLWESEDGVTWSAAGGVPTFDCTLLNISSLGVIAAGSTGYEHRIYRRDQTLGWVKVFSASTPQYLYSLCYFESSLYAFGSAGYALKSSDGISWLRLTSESNETPTNCAVTDQGILMLATGYLKRSTLTEPISLAGEPLTAPVNAIAYGDGVTIALGGNASIYRLNSNVSAAPVVDFSVADVGDRYMRLSWSVPDGDPAAIVLQYRLSGTATWLDVGTLLPGSSSNALVVGLTPKSTYEYRIRSIEPGKVSSYQILQSPLPVTIGPIQEWRRTHFGSQENLGIGANENDWDRDGTPNLMEYAMGTDPLAGDFPFVTIASAPYANPSFPGYNTHSMEFWCNGLNTDINYIVETSTDLVTWTILEKSIGGKRFEKPNFVDSYYPYPNRNPLRKVTVSVSTTAPKFFYRIKIEPSE